MNTWPLDKMYYISHCICQ